MKTKTVYYYGQYVALVVAETFEQAQDAAFHVEVSYQPAKLLVRMEQSPMREQSGGDDMSKAPRGSKYSRGDAQAAYQQAPVKLDYTYVTPVETHNPMEMHGTVATWDGDRLTLYESSQGVVNHHNVASQVLGMPLEKSTSSPVSSDPDSAAKLFPWPHSWLAAVAAKKVNGRCNSRFRAS